MSVMDSHGRIRPPCIPGRPSLTTLEDAGRFIAGLPERDQHRQAWIHATQARGASIMEATDAVDAALFLQGKLELRK
jgi:hypothetical protein